jgi:hypothetical protein
MTRVGLAIVLVVVCGCRRKHVAPTYESDTPAAPSATAAPSGTSDNVQISPPAPAAPNPRLPDGGTLNGDPRGPRPAAWQAIENAAMPALQACFDVATLPYGEIPVTVHYTVEPRGETGAVKATGAAPRATLDCCERVVEGLTFPPYGGPKVERELAFTWSKRDPRAAADGGR